jgi:hypothetical protein
MDLCEKQLKNAKESYPFSNSNTTLDRLTSPQDVDDEIFEETADFEIKKVSDVNRKDLDEYIFRKR